MEKQPITLKRSQKSSCKKTPAVKVVYISNPMKIKASPSEFRAVVQQLTGRYATSPPSHQQVHVTKKHNEEEEQEHDVRGRSRSDLSYESAGCHREDEVVGDFIITPQMLEGFSTHPLLPSDFSS